MKSKPFSELEIAYIRRVAGRVPMVFISSHLGRDVRSVRDFCFRKKVATRVPVNVLRKHWPDFLPKSNRKL